MIIYRNMVNDAATTPILVDIVNYEGRMLKIEPKFSETELSDFLVNERRHDIKDADVQISEKELYEFCDSVEKRITELISEVKPKEDRKSALLMKLKLAQALYSVPDHDNVTAGKPENLLRWHNAYRAKTAYLLARAYFILVAYTHLNDDLTSSMPERVFYRDAAHQFLDRSLQKYAEAIKYATTNDEQRQYAAEYVKILNTPLVKAARTPEREVR